MSQPGTALAVLSDPSIIEERPTVELRFSRQTWLAILAATLLTGLLAMGAVLLFGSQSYAVSTQLLVLSGTNTNDNTTLVRSLEEIIKSENFAAELKQSTGLSLPVQTIKGMVSASSPPGSAVIDVKVQYADQEVAQQVSDNVVPTMRSLFDYSQRNLPIEQRIPGPIVQELFQNPIREVVFVAWWMAFLLGSVLGFVVSFAIAAARQYRQPQISSAREVGDALDLPVLARLPIVGNGRSSNAQDAVLGMLAAIERLGVSGPIHRLVVVGPRSDEERSKLILALGSAIARNFDQPVAIVDADLEHGTLTKLVGAEAEPGLSECLSGELRIEQTLLRLENGHIPEVMDQMSAPPGMVRVLPAGLNRGGSLLRMRSNLHQVLGGLSGQYVVIIDGPQVPGPVPSGQLLSMADATLVVVSEGATSVRDVRFTGDALRSYTTNPVGAVVLKR